MARAIWKGSISFGLVGIPVGLFSAEKPDELSFRQLDRRTMSPIGYRKYNKANGQDVDADDIVRAFEYNDEQYVVLSDEDFRRANPEKSQTIEITDFVDAEEIPPTFFDKPYYLAPVGRNPKAYALLREALRRSGKVGIARVTIRSREHLAAVVPQGDVLVLEILRYANELRATDDLEVPTGDLKALGVQERELDLAERLIEGMTGAWEPEKYHDEYRDDLMALIRRRVESGETAEPDESPVPDARPRDVIDIMSLLKRSVEATAPAAGAKGGKAAKGAKPAAKKAAPKSTAARPPQRRRKSA